MSSARFVSAGGTEVKAPEGLSNATDDAWDKARKQVEQARKPSSTTEPAPGTQEGGVSLYEHLQAQKLAKQEAFEEASKLRNQFRPLDEAEVEFLEGLKQKQRSEAANVRKETAEQLDAFRKERAAAEQLAQEQALKQEELAAAEHKAKDQWSAGRKRRRAAIDDKPEGVKVPKTSRVAPNNESAPHVPAENHADPIQAKSTPVPAKSEAPAMSSLVAYDSDSDG